MINFKNRNLKASLTDVVSVLRLEIIQVNPNILHEETHDRILKRLMFYIISPYFSAIAFGQVDFK